MTRLQITVDKWGHDYVVEVHEDDAPIDKYFQVFTNFDDADEYALTLRVKLPTAEIVIL